MKDRPAMLSDINEVLEIIIKGSNFIESIKKAFESAKFNLEPEKKQNCGYSCGWSLGNGGGYFWADPACTFHSQPEKDVIPLDDCHNRPKERVTETWNSVDRVTVVSKESEGVEGLIGEVWQRDRKLNSLGSIEECRELVKPLTDRIKELEKEIEKKTKLFQKSMGKSVSISMEWHQNYALLEKENEALKSRLKTAGM